MSDFEKEECSSQDDEAIPLFPENASIRREPTSISRHLLPFVFHVGFAIIWMMTLWWHFHSELQPIKPLWPGEFQPAAEAIEYETIIFNPGNASIRDTPLQPYTGSTFETDLAWWHLFDVGFITLTPEQNEQLEMPTQNVSRLDHRPMIQLDVFHQLHCLDTTRKVAFGTYIWHNKVADLAHLDHCFEYLRQVLMCHSDVTPIVNIPRTPGDDFWRPNFASTHTCRNFQKIHDWAAKANSSGTVVDMYPRPH